MDINIICEPVENNALWITDIINGATHEAIRRGLNIIVSTDGKISKQIKHQSESGERRIALVIGYLSGWINEALTNLSQLGVEPILVSVYQHRLKSEYSYVSFNTAEAMRYLVGYLAGIGCSKIALFGLHRDTIGDMSKLGGFAAGIRDNGLTFSGEDIYSRGLIADCAERLLSNISRYQAVMCTSDLIAVYLVKYLDDHGIRVPEDIFVTGFGNWLTVDNYDPSITRMRTDLFELGVQSVKHYIHMQNNPQTLHSSAVISCSLQIGKSTANLSAAKLLHTGTASAVNSESSAAYSSDSDIMRVLRLELFVRNADRTDFSILRAINENKTYSQISEDENISESTIKYRLSKLQRVCGFTNRGELVSLVADFGLI